MPTKQTQLSIINYLDYRQFLCDWYAAAKKQYGFSYRVFSRRAGFNSPAVFKQVAEGDRGLTEKSLPKFAKGLGLNAEDKKYFYLLVKFNQAKSHEKKNTYYQKLIRTRQYRELKPVAEDQYEYYSTWYHAVVRELVVTKEFDGNPEWVAKRVTPRLTIEQVQHSINLLERLGFIARNESEAGPLWLQASPVVSSGAEVASIPLFNYHRSVLDLVKNQMTTVAWQNRDVSTLTIGMVKERLPELKKKIQEFRREIIQMVSSDRDTEEVFVLSMQLLPVTEM